MPFPPSDVISALSAHLHFQSLATTLRQRRPELAERVHFDDAHGGMALKVELSGGQSIVLARIYMGYAVVWAVKDPVLNSEPSIWPLHTPDDVLLDVVYAHASAQLTGQPVASPWRWHESKPSVMTELADLLDAGGVRVRRVAAENRYFAYGSHIAPKLDIVGGSDGSILEAEFPDVFVRVSLKTTLGWFVDLHSPRWGGWCRMELGRLLRHTSSPTPGVPRPDVSVQEIAELLCKGPDAWDMVPPRVRGQHDGQPTNEPRSDQPGQLPARPTQLTPPGPVEGRTEQKDGHGEAVARKHRQGSPAPRSVTKAILQQLTTLGFSDLLEGEADTPIRSDTFHIVWHSSNKDVSTSAIQRLNGVAAAAGDNTPKRLIVITSAGLTRPAATFADKAKAYAFRLDQATGRLMALNSLACEAELPVDSPNTRQLESW